MNQLDQYHNQQLTRRKCHIENAARLEFTEDVANTKSICARFDEVVKHYSTNIALKSRSRKLTYMELDLLSNGIAQRLLRLGVDQDEPIGLLFEHCVQAVVAQMGVLKAASTRVELDVTFPVQRLQQIIDHCQIRYLITKTEYLQLAEQLSDQNTVIINLDDDESLASGENPKLPLYSGTPATISYSSGSTGEPKQTIRSHLNELHAAMRVTDSIGLNAQDRMLFTRSSTAIPLHALLHGACYYPVDLKKDGDLLSLIDWIRDERISVYRSPVSTFRGLAHLLQKKDVFPDLRLIVLQGEPVFRSDVDIFQKRFSDHCVLVSSLGVSEFGDFAHYLVDKATIISTSTVPGGYALKGAQVEILKDDTLRSDELGEIGIRGSFINNSSTPRVEVAADTLDGEPQVATYKTGDIGEISSDGCIFHRGRTDFQVKVRGNRVDLQEVEAALLDLEGIAQVVAVGHTDSNGDVSLVAYIESKSIDSESIREKLKAALPSYMVPTLLIQLDELPRTLTGKIDRKSLPSPARRTRISDVAVGARNEVEPGKTIDEVAAIWKEVLQLDEIGLQDNFLDIGGDSLKAMMVFARIKQKFNVSLAYRMLFDAGTILQIAETIEKLSADPLAIGQTPSSRDTSR